MKKRIDKYAELIVKKGVNVQKDQIVVVRSSTETKELARALSKAAYQVGAKRVYVDWSDDYLAKYTYEYASLEELTDIKDFAVDRQKYYVDSNACFISITSPIPELNQGLDGNKLQQTMIANQKAVSFFQKHLMANKSQWCVVGAPNVIWAEKVFPNLKGEEAYNALWDAILNSSRVYENNDPIKEWDIHNETLSKHNKKLNDFNLKKLHFENSLGTNLIVELVENHIWAGGSEMSGEGVMFNPNIPTEETFTMPYKYGTSGKVYATKPLNYQGKLIEDFFLEFKEGKVVNFGAKKEVETLKQLLEVDDGSSYIGEIALISHDSPISNTNILFYNTLYDENASSHMALGKSYAMNVKGGTKMSEEELTALGANDSLIHVDFMFGSSDMKINGIQADGSEILIFKDGNFVI